MHLFSHEGYQPKINVVLAMITTKIGCPETKSDHIVVLPLTNLWRTQWQL
jgi:hypothetical protein